MQTSMFTAAQDCLEKAIKNLEQFEFSEAQQNLSVARQIDPYIQNIDFYAEILNRFKQFGFTAKSPAAELAEFWHLLKNQQHERGSATESETECHRILAYRLLELDAFDASGFVQNTEFFLHEAALHLHLDKPQTTYDILMDIDDLQAHFPARYFGYLADAASGTINNFKTTNVGYLKLLATDPGQIDWCTLRNMEIKQVFNELAEQKSIATAYGYLPFACWRQKIITVPAGNSFIFDILNDVQRRYEEKGDTSERARAHMFALYVFLEASDSNGQIDPEQRLKMKGLEPTLFEMYMDERTQQIGA